MLLTPHAMVGAAIGASTDNLVYIIILAMLSHFILDAIPHFDWGTWHNYEEFKLEAKDYLLLGLDAIMVLILTYWVWDNLGRNNYILVGEFFAVLVDLLFNVPFWKNITQKIPILRNVEWLHDKIHSRLKMKYWYVGVITQILILLIAFIFMFN